LKGLMIAIMSFMTGSPCCRRSKDSEGQRTVEVRAQRPGDAARLSSNFVPDARLALNSLK
jgi:hypothetical protein